METNNQNLLTIKTELSDFCHEFARYLTPVTKSLDDSLREIRGGSSDSDTLQRPIASLSDVHHRMESLVSKVEEQQAYVIIFGPIKSGKSTLMNAISASYVSEVTSLPAYPCIVHVKHGENHRYRATRYDGEKVEFPDNARLQEEIRVNYKRLAERIREIEDQGEAFDPGVHCPDAIRRIDVEVPAPNLKDSLAVLVDTPGLYTRMKFGYDLMTREFRNSAASAVFVVKTDNLFLEQVFDEFTQLLELFSRIFLVVNIDSKKQDLEPDGSFHPSLESKDPGEIVKAFESLAMRAPLRKAAEEGRLRIYPVDLLSAASASLKQGGKEPEDTAASTDTPAEAPPAEADESEEKDESRQPSDEQETTPATEDREDARPADAFAALLRDLTDYLNSNDYLHEFMGDSLHQGKTLGEEIQAACSEEAIQDFLDHQRALRGESIEVSEQLTAIEKFDAVDWNAVFEKTRSENRAAAEKFSDKLREEMSAKGLDQIDRWFESDDSVSSLNKSLNRLMEDCCRRIESDSRERVTSLASGYLGGLNLLDEDVARLLNRDEQLFPPAIKAGRTALQESDPDCPNGHIEISDEWLPVKKGFWDWILFRSQGSIRRSLFGPASSMDKQVPGAVKKRRLGDVGKEKLTEQFSSHLESIFPEVPVGVSERLCSTYTTVVTSKFKKSVASSKEQHTRRMETLEKQIRENDQIKARLDQLALRGTELTEAIAPLIAKYAAVDWDDRGEQAVDKVPEEEGTSGQNPEISDDSPSPEGSQPR